MSDAESSATPLEEPSFSIGAVSAIAGIPEATLRVWERRYQFPHAARTPGGQRHYSHRDLLSLRWVRRQMDTGMRPSQAIRALDLMSRDTAVLQALHEPVSPCAPPDAATRALQQQILEALLAYDSDRAQALLDDIATRRTVTSVVLDVVSPTLSAIGEAWATGQAEVAAEHFATNFLRHQLLKWMQASPASHPAPPVALCCAPEELHEGSLLMLGVTLRQLRWPVLYLGQSLPLSELGTFAQHARPAMIAFVAMTEASALSLAEWPRWLSQAHDTRAPIVAYGGRAFSRHPSLVERVPGAWLGATLCEGSQRIDHVLLHLAALGR